MYTNLTLPKKGSVRTILERQTEKTRERRKQEEIGREGDGKGGKIWYDSGTAELRTAAVTAAVTATHC